MQFTRIYSLLLLTAIAASTVAGVTITFWSDNNMQGEKYNIDMVHGQCYKLGVSNDRLSSISTNGQCVDIYTRDDCFGGMFRMEPNSTACHKDFGECDMNDRVSSVRLCPRCRNSCYFYDGQSGNQQDYDRDACHCHCNCGDRSCNGNNGGTYYDALK